MKYNRYNIKKKKKNNYHKGVVLVVVLIVAVLIVFVISPFVFKDKDKTSIPDIPKNQNESSKDLEISNFVIVQFGNFQNQENAIKLQLELAKTLGNAYIIQDVNSSRVIYGIYAESEGINILKELSDKKIENSKMIFAVKENDLCNKEIIELISANLQVINTLSNKNIKSIQTEDLKKWTSTLTEIDEKSINYKVLEELKTHTLNIEKELTKINIKDSYIFLYNTLKKIK